MAGGWTMLVLVNIIMIGYAGAMVYSDYLLGEWTQSISAGKDEF